MHSSFSVERNQTPEPSLSVRQTTEGQWLDITFIGMDHDIQNCKSLESLDWVDDSSLFLLLFHSSVTMTISKP